MDLLDLGIETMPADFHIFGNLPFDKERVKSLASGKALLLAIALSMKAEIPYGPVALVVSRLVDEMQNFFRCYRCIFIRGLIAISFLS